MALGAREIIPQFEQQAGRVKAISVGITPVRLVGADEEVLPTKTYTFKIQIDGTVNNTGVKKFYLPTASVGAIVYGYTLTIGGIEVGSGEFSLFAGGAIYFSELVEAGVTATRSLQQYVDEQIAEALEDFEPGAGGAGDIPFINYLGTPANIDLSNANEIPFINYAGAAANIPLV